MYLMWFKNTIGTIPVLNCIYIFYIMLESDTESIASDSIIITIEI